MEMKQQIGPFVQYDKKGKMKKNNTSVIDSQDWFNIIEQNVNNDKLQ